MFRSRAVRDEQKQAVDGAWLAQLRPRLVRFALPMVPLAMLSWISNIADRYVLAAYGGVSATGLYSAGYAIASQPFINVSIIATSTFRPVLFDAVARNDDRSERRAFRAWFFSVAALSALGVACFIALGPRVSRVLLAPEFRTAAGVFPWIAGAYGLQAVQQSFEGRIYARQRTDLLLYLQVLTAGMATLMYLLLIPRNGPLGAAIATCAAFALSCAATVVVSRRSAERDLV